MKTVSWCNMKRTRMLNGNNNSMILANNEDEKRAPEVAAFWAVSTLLGLLSQHGKVDKMSYDLTRKKVERNRVWEEFRPCTCLLRLRKLILGFLITEIFAGAQEPFLTPFRLLISRISMPRLPSQNVQPQDPEHVSSCPQLRSYEPLRESVSNKEARINSENENNGIIVTSLRWDADESSK